MIFVCVSRCRVLRCNGYIWWRVSQHSADQVSLLIHM